jgi:hypothetical protein
MAVLAIGLAVAAVAPAGYAAVGFLAGQLIGNLLFPQKGTDVVQEGPRLNDLRVQVSTWGASIPLLFGQMRTAGNVIWCPGIRESRHETSQSAGGKGGGGGQTATQISYTYDTDVAIAICEGEIAGIRKIWADGRMIYDVGAAATTEEIVASNANAANFRVYTGSETQLADPTMEAALGAGNVPGHRGLAYVVFTGFQLADYGNRVPNFTFEVIATGTTAEIAVPEAYLDGAIAEAFYGINFNGAAVIFAFRERHLYRFSATTGALLGIRDMQTQPITLRSFSNSTMEMGALCPDGTGRVWAVCRGQLSGSTMDYLIRWDENGEPSRFVYAGALTSGLDRNLAGIGGNGWIYYVLQGAGCFAINLNTAPEITSVPPPAATHIIDTGISTSATYAAAFAQSPGGKVAALHWLDLVTVYLDQFNDGGRTELTLSGPTPGTVFSGARYDHLENLWLAWEESSPSTHPELKQIDEATGAVTRSIVLPNGAMSTLKDFFFSRDGFLWVNISGSWQKRDYTSGAILYVSTTGQTYNPSTASIATPYGNFHNSANSPAQLQLRLIEPIPRLTVTTTQTVGTVQSALCVRAGLDLTDIDVTELTDTLDGYGVTRVGSARSASEPLQKVYFYDAVESDDKLKFVKRGGSSVVTIPFEDLAMRDQGAGEVFGLVRTQEQELPREITLSFLNKDGDYLQATEYARRLIVRSEINILEELPIVLTPAHAAQVAESLLYDAHTERNRFTFSTSRKYAAYEPTDVVEVEGPDATYTVHLRRKVDAGARIDWEGVAADAPVYTSTTVGATDQETAPGVAFSGPTRLELLDIPILRDQDDDAGPYAALGGHNTAWRGGVLYSSPDGINYGERGSALNRAVMGVCNTTLGTFTGGNVFDEVNTLDVTVDQGGELESFTALEVMNGANGALVGDELIQFRTAVVVSGNKWRLSGLLRGRRGTEVEISAHTAGETFVLLTSGGVIRVDGELGDVNVERSYKGVSFGQAVGDASAKQFTNTGAGLKPLAVVHGAGHRHQPSTNDWTFTWVRRGRITSEWLDSIDVPLGEDSESYEIDIVNISTGAILRTLTATSETVTYTAAQQTTDFGSAQTTVKRRIYQISASVGRGFVNEQTF